jgi:hypothetical protein
MIESVIWQFDPKVQTGQSSKLSGRSEPVEFSWYIIVVILPAFPHLDSPSFLSCEFCDLNFV